MLHVPSAVRLQSSIAAPTGMSRRAEPSFSAEQELHRHTDPLDGSLGPFIVSCVLVLVVILAVASVFWGVHRRTRLRLRTQQGTVLSTESHVSLLSAGVLQRPPSRLRIRSPIQRLRLLRGAESDGPAALPLWHSPPKITMPAHALPEIVLSRPSPMSRAPVSPSLTTCAPPGVFSVGSLRVPQGGAKATLSPQKPKPKPLIQLVPPPRHSSQPSPPRRALAPKPLPSSPAQPQFQRQPLAVHKQVKQIKTCSPAKKASPGKSPKKTKMTILGKENQRPHMQVKMNRTRKIFGSRDDTWSQIM